MNWADYQVGRRVVCIDDTRWDARTADILPVRGRVYTIRAAEVAIVSATDEGMLALLFDELHSHPSALCRGISVGPEWWFQASCFKPVDESRLNQFRSILAPAARERLLS